jgi:hypothetical protein
MPVDVHILKIVALMCFTPIVEAIGRLRSYSCIIDGEAVSCGDDARIRSCLQSSRGQVRGNSTSCLLLLLYGARFGFVHLRQRHREHPVLELSPDLVLIDATRKAEVPGIVRCCIP